MSAELIYVSHDENVVRWIAETLRRRNAAEEALTLFQQLVTSELGPNADGTLRGLRVTAGLIVGVTVVPGRSTPVGWMLNPELEALIPDTNTSAGQTWQQAIDDLPAATDEVDLREVGMVEMVSITIDGVDAGHTHVSLHLGIEGGTAFAIWENRAVKPAVDEAIAALGQGVWMEMPRSQWFTRVEAFEELGR